MADRAKVLVEFLFFLCNYICKFSYILQDHMVLMFVSLEESCEPKENI